MTTLNPAAVKRLLLDAGLGTRYELVPLAGGANNRVYWIETENGSAVLKAYFRHPSDPRDRLASEFAFSRFAWSSGIRSLPEPLACDPEAGLGLFEHVNGRSPAAGDITEELLEQATDFVRDLSTTRWRPLASRLKVASEACFSIAEHLGTVARRVERLATSPDPVVAAFAIRQLFPAWEDVIADVHHAVSDSGLSLDRTLDATSRCVSPSDFGFHNALLEIDGRARFLDFEYAGWDDPAKLICDFFSQPAVPVPAGFLEAFAQRVAEPFPNPELVLTRTRALLPVYRVKWVCIRLNEFLPTGGKRRAFSLSETDLEARRATQLTAARTALHQLQEAA